MRRLITLITFLLLPTIAAADVADKVYAGFNFGIRDMGFKDECSNMFSKYLRQYSVFAGLQYNKWVGIECNFFTTNQSNRDVTINKGESSLGVQNYSGIFNEQYQTSTDLQGAQLYLTGAYPIARRTKLFGYMGIGIARLNLKANLIDRNYRAPTSTVISNNRIDQSMTESYPLFGVGLDYELAKYLGCRAGVSWENTSKFKSKFERTTGTTKQTLSVQAKNSVIYSLSIYVKVNL